MSKRLEIEAITDKIAERNRWLCALIDENGHIIDLADRECPSKTNKYAEILGNLVMLELLLKHSGNKLDDYYDELSDLVTKMAKELDIEISSKI